MTNIFGFPYIAWCGVLALITIGALAVHANGRRNALRARPVPGRVVWVMHNSNETGRVQSVMARVAVTDASGEQQTILTFPDGDTGGVWTGRDLTLWQRPDGRTPPSLLRFGSSRRYQRSLATAGTAFAVLVLIVAIHVGHVPTEGDTKAPLKPFGIVFAASSAVVAAVQLARLVKTRRILRGTPAAGQVLGLVRQTHTNQDNTTSTTYRPIVTFTTADGQHVYGLTTTTGSLRKKWTGRTIKVRHEPGHPENFRLAKPSEAWSPLINLLGCLVLIALGLASTAYAMKN